MGNHHFLVGNAASSQPQLEHAPWTEYWYSSAVSSYSIRYLVVKAQCSLVSEAGSPDTASTGWLWCPAASAAPAKDVRNVTDTLQSQSGSRYFSFLLSTRKWPLLSGVLLSAIKCFSHLEQKQLEAD